MESYAMNSQDNPFYSIIDDPTYTIHQALTYSNDSKIINRFTGALVVYSITLPPFLVLGFVVAILLIIRWRTMVFIKRCLYGLVVLMSCLQILSITSGIMYSVCVLIGNQKECMDPFAAIQYSCGNLTVILCVFCFLTITRILYKVYFDKSQWWMRVVENQQESLGKTVPKKIAIRNQRFGKFVKWTAIISAIGLLIIAPLHIATIMITSLTSLMPGVKAATASSIGYNRYYADAVLALGYWFLIFFFGIINIVVGVSLTGKLGGEQENVPLQRRKACRQLNLLNALQLVFGGITGSIVIMAILTLVQYEIYIAGITLQRISIFFFAVALTFIYGPLDELDLKETKEEIIMATRKILPAALVDRKDRIEESEGSPRDDARSTVAELASPSTTDESTPSPPKDEETPVQNQV
ncbi:predicted protein [Naegleria gruberi]|uniref:Predicted protein n=1 Tax=Naegleria gruberi TaxID=5762 RepID=D2W1L3_NAEGR|nr:uncharacterized protein NAEGRDRAFT_53991 [Naegleria gruberi]EFC37111.1 predicted protein [Naegleria gruberi]|eukprot:XP_002669855.1 predicted protein [Naegleria gruberi strain NEG-M]